MRSLALVCLTGIGALGASADQPADAPAVKALVRQLDSNDPAERDRAEEALLKLGPESLEHLPSSDDDQLSGEQKQRLARVLPVLRERQAAASAQSSTIVIDLQTMHLSSYLKRVEEQTGNRFVDMREQLGQERVDPEIRVPPARTAFWPAIDDVLRQAHLVMYPNQEGRSIGLAEGATPASMLHYSGAFRFALQQVVCRRSFTVGEEESFCDTMLTLQVEPRLKPIQLELPADGLSARDDQGDELAYRGPGTSYLTFDGDSFELGMPLRWSSPPRTATTIQELAGTLHVTLLASVKNVTFRDLTRARDVVVKHPEVVVTLSTFDTSDEGVWRANVIIQRTGELQEPDSYLQSSLKNEIFLVTADGTRIPQNGGLSEQDLGDGRIETEYLFVDVGGSPTEYELLVVVPAGVVRVPVPFRFQQIPLP